MAGLPKGLLKEVIEEGYKPPEAMKEAWRRVKLQKRRYGERMSHGGGYPLGHTGRNKPRKRKPHKLTFSTWLIAVEKEFDLAGVYPKWSGFTAKQLYQAYSPKKAAELLIATSKRRKNPVLKFKDLKEEDAFIFEAEKTMPSSGMALGPWIKFDNRTYYKDKALSPGQIRHLIRVGSINVKVIKTGEVINPNRQKTRKNPIAFYNPAVDQLIYGRVLEIRAVKTSGPHRGERYSHKFGPHVQAVGLSNGWVLLKSTDGARLWKNI